MIWTIDVLEVAGLVFSLIFLLGYWIYTWFK